MHLIFSYVLLALAAGTVKADTGGVNNLNVTSGCKTALEDALHNPDIVNCLNSVGLEEIIGITANTSIVTVVNEFVWPFCSQDPCDPGVLSVAEANISSSCADDISPEVTDVVLIGVNYILDFAFQEFQAARQVVCLEDLSNNTNCVVELLTDLQTELGEPLSLDGIGMFFKNLLKGHFPHLNLTALVCNSCAQGIFDVVQPNIIVRGLFEYECGHNFTDSSATGIAEITGTAAQALITPTGNSRRMQVNNVVRLAAVILTYLAGLTTLF